MVQNNARALTKKAPVAYEEPEDDWQPLHPLHRRLVDEYSGAAAEIGHRPRFGARLAMIVVLGIASWAVVIGAVRVLTTMF